MSYEVLKILRCHDIMSVARKEKKGDQVLCSPLVSPDQDRDKEWKHGFLLQLYEDIRRKRLSGIAQIISP